MLTREQAEQLALDHLKRIAADIAEPLELIITEVTERPASWVFFYNSVRYLRTNNVSDALAGNGPIVVSKRNGKLIQAGTACPIERSIVDAESHL